MTQETFHTLHTLNAAPSNTSLWEACLAALLPGDSLLLIENAVLGAEHSRWQPQLNALSQCALLAADSQARGIQTTELEQIDDETFVQWCCTHTKVVSWF